MKKNKLKGFTKNKKRLYNDMKGVDKMLVSQKNLRQLSLDLDFRKPIYVHRKWEQELSDLITQLLIVIKLKYNLYVHPTTTEISVGKKEVSQIEFCVFFMREDNRDIFTLKIKTNSQNEMIFLEWKTQGKENKIGNKISQTKTIKRLDFSFNGRDNSEHFYCSTIKSSVDFLRQLLKYI